MKALKMKNFIKYLKTFRTYFAFSLLLLLGETLFATGIDEVQAQKLGNFLDNAFANMNDEEKELFIQEVQREQEKLLAMSPEERAAHEELVARELDHLMNNSPYVEWFENPANPGKTEVDTTKESDAEKITEPVIKKSTKTKSKPNTVIISKDLKEQAKSLIQNIVQAIDSILLKTTNMQQIQHASWNHGKWVKLSSDLQILKSELQMIVNSDKVLSDFLSSDQTILRNHIQDFEKALSQAAIQLKTPDAMGLVVVFEGQPKIIDQNRYDQAVLKLKTITDLVGDQIASTDLVVKIKALLAKHAPTESKEKIDSSKLSSKKTEIKNTCKPGYDHDASLKQVQHLLAEIKRCANAQLIELSLAYQKNPSTAVKRKLQWRLSELELHLGRLAKIFEASSCKKDLQMIIDQASCDYQMLHQNIDILNEVQATHELSILIKQIESHAKNLQLGRPIVTEPSLIN